MPLSPPQNHPCSARKPTEARSPASGAAAGLAQEEKPFISPEDLDEFQDIYLRVYGVALEREGALIEAQQLIELFRILLRPPR